MPIHAWTRVDAGIFHDFHTGWVIQIKSALNSGILPPDCYALVEPIAGGPDVLALQRPTTTPHHPTNVGRELVPMPVFLTLDEYVSLPLEPTYQAAWELVPEVWRAVLEAERGTQGAEFNA